MKLLPNLAIIFIKNKPHPKNFLSSAQSLAEVESQHPQSS